MKLASAILLSVALLACSSQPTVSPTTFPAPPAPTAVVPTSGSARLWVLVVDDGGGCIADATVDLVIGDVVIRSAPQELPCDAWAYEGGVLFTSLPNASMIVRTSAPGYKTQESTAVPTSGSFRAVVIVPSRTQ